MVFILVVFQKYWDIIYDSICVEVERIFSGGFLEESLNSTMLTLIPKVENPSMTTQFKPISLCNLIYKVIVKVIANHLRKCLPCIIAPYQSSFVPGRHITDNTRSDSFNEE